MSEEGVTVQNSRLANSERNARRVCFRSHKVISAWTFFFHFFVCVLVSSESVRDCGVPVRGGTKKAEPCVASVGPHASTLRLAQRRHAEIEQHGARGPDDRSRRSLPAARGTVPASIATASPWRRAIACRPVDFSRRPTETDQCPRLPRDCRKPSSPRPSSPSRRLTPMSTPSCRRRSSGRCASGSRAHEPRRAAARSTCVFSCFPNLETATPHDD